MLARLFGKGPNPYSVQGLLKRPLNEVVLDTGDPDLDQILTVKFERVGQQDVDAFAAGLPDQRVTPMLLRVVALVQVAHATPGELERFGAVRTAAGRLPRLADRLWRRCRRPLAPGEAADLLDCATYALSFPHAFFGAGWLSNTLRSPPLDEIVPLRTPFYRAHRGLRRAMSAFVEAADRSERRFDDPQFARLLLAMCRALGRTEANCAVVHDWQTTERAAHAYRAEMLDRAGPLRNFIDWCLTLDGRMPSERLSSGIQAETKQRIDTLVDGTPERRAGLLVALARVMTVPRSLDNYGASGARFGIGSFVDLSRLGAGLLQLTNELDRQPLRFTHDGALEWMRAVEGERYAPLRSVGSAKGPGKVEPYGAIAKALGPEDAVAVELHVEPWSQPQDAARRVAALLRGAVGSQAERTSLAS